MFPMFSKLTLRPILSGINYKYLISDYNFPEDYYTFLLTWKKV